MAQLPAKRERPLEGLRIIDLGTAIAGPYGPLFLGDFGAEVIKVEDPSQGDMLRLTPPFYNGGALCWAEGGRNKKSITVNLRKPEGQRIIKDLVLVSDVVVENYRPGTLEKWGLGYEELKKINPRIILIRVSGFGQSGPYRQQAGFDTVGLAMGGFTYLTGDPQGPPMRPGFVVGDYMTALFNALATMMAIYHRDIKRTGEGQWIDVSLYETIFRITEYTVAAYDKLGLVRERAGNTHPSAAPMDHYQTKDGKWVAILVSRDNIFARFTRAIDREELRDDPRFSSNHKRAENAKTINEITREWVGSLPLEEVMGRLSECKVPASPIYGIKDIFEKYCRD
jgi:formyl-CoA transferase